METARPPETLLGLGGAFHNALLFDPSILKAMPEVRDMCAADKCRQYGANWACPPACGELDACAERMSRCETGLLVQTVGELEDEFDYDGMMAANRLHDTLFLELAHKAALLWPERLALSAGACLVCDSCACPEPCRHPESCHPPLGAYGLFVSRVCADCGARYNNGLLTITYTSCVLI